MCKVLLTLLILLISVSSEAAFKVYLKNGSEIPDVSSYDEIGDDVTLYFRTGSMEISKKDILKIEGSGDVEKDKGAGEAPETQENQEAQKTEEKTVTIPPAPSAPQSSVSENSERINELKDQLNSINSEIKDTEDREASLQQSINDKFLDGRYIYNRYQVKQLENEIDPLKQELFTVREKKKELMQRKSDMESELKQLQ